MTEVTDAMVEAFCKAAFFDGRLKSVGAEHNALADALWNKEAWEFVTARADAAEARVKVLEGLLKRSWPWLSAAREGIETDPDPAFSAANLDAYTAEVRAALASKEEGGG